MFNKEAKVQTKEETVTLPVEFERKRKSNIMRDIFCNTVGTDRLLTCKVHSNQLQFTTVDFILQLFLEIENISNWTHGKRRVQTFLQWEYLSVRISLYLMNGKVSILISLLLKRKIIFNLDILWHSSVFEVQTCQHRTNRFSAAISVQDIPGWKSLYLFLVYLFVSLGEGPILYWHITN